MTTEKKSSTIPAILWLIFFFPVGLYWMWKKTSWNKAVKWVITVIFALFLLGTITNNSDSKNASSSNTVASVKVTAAPKPTKQPTKVPTTPTPTPTPVPTDANGFPMNYQTVTVAQVAKVPSAYNNKVIMFTCNVSGFVKGDSGDAAGFNCSDPNDYGSILQVDSALFDYTQINQGDVVRVDGMGSGAASGTNAFGGNVTEAVVGGILINDLTTGYKN